MKPPELPDNAEWVDAGAVSGWMYDLTSPTDDRFTFLLYEANDGYHVRLAYPRLEELGVTHRSMVLADGELVLGQRPGGLAVAYALSARWAIMADVPHTTEAQLLAGVASDPLIIPDVELVSARVNAEVLGQHEAVGLLCQSACEHIAKAAPQRPLVLVAVGPTGVGKSESVKALAGAIQGLYPHLGYDFLWINLSQYQERYRVSEIFGSPPGYVGHGTKTNLVQALSQNPRQIMLWDELDKAHVDVVSSLLALLDEGKLQPPTRLEDGRSQLDCRPSVFVFTTNLRWQPIISSLSAEDAFADADKVNSTCQRQFIDSGHLSELVGRFRQFIVYRPLNDQAFGAIARACVVKLGREYGFDVVDVRDAVLATILKQERQLGLGARPLQAIASRLLSPAFMQARGLGMKGRVVVRRDGGGFGCSPP